MKKLIYCIAVLGLIFTSCSKDEETIPVAPSVPVLTTDIDEALLTKTVKEATTTSEIDSATLLAVTPVNASNSQDITTVVKNSDGSYLKTILIQREDVELEKWEITFNNDGSVITVIDNLQSKETPTYTLQGKLRLDGSVALVKNVTFGGLPNNEAITFSSYVINPDNSYHYFGTYKSGATFFSVTEKNGSSKGTVKDMDGKIISTLEFSTDGETSIKQIINNEVHTTTIKVDKSFIVKDSSGNIVNQG